ncbi:MAG: restriction endonuclease [bacterium]|nr:restriction endonuclease [bacterium]
MSGKSAERRAARPARIPRLRKVRRGTRPPLRAPVDPPEWSYRTSGHDRPGADRMVGWIIALMIAGTLLLLVLYSLRGALGLVGLIATPALLLLPLLVVVLRHLLRPGSSWHARATVFGHRWGTHRRRARSAQQNRAIVRLRRYRCSVHMLELDPLEFEHLVLDYFRAVGFSARSTPPQGDGGYDGVIEQDGVRAFVQCKRYASKVPVPAVRDFLGVVTKHGVGGWFVTTVGFSRGVRQFAKGTAIRLIDGEDLARRIAALQIPDPRAARPTVRR